jgi:hypothetical protein
MGQTHKIFVAGSWVDRLAVKELVELLEETTNILVVEHFWTHTQRGKWREFAKSDKQGLLDAEIFVMYNGKKDSPGKFIEFGAAMIREIPIYIFGRKISSVFRYFATGHFPTTNKVEIRDILVRIIQEREENIEFELDKINSNISMTIPELHKFENRPCDECDELKEGNPNITELEPHLSSKPPFGYCQKYSTYNPTGYDYCPKIENTSE